MSPWSYPPVEVRFWAKVRKSDGCWLWMGLKDKDGYGQLRRDKQPGERRGRMVKAARLAWELENGLMPDGMGALHTCDNPPCVRHDHIYPGTPVENGRDLRERVRHPGRQKTHCSQGHEFTPENTIWRPNKTRACRTCHNGRRRRIARQPFQLEV